MMEINIDGYCNEILWYSTKREDGTYRIPIVLDFDFTCTKDSSWLEGTWVENPHCFETLKKWIKLGCVFILDTMRGKDNIQPAIDWLFENGIELYGIGLNPDQCYEEGCSTKVWGIFDIDDRNVPSFLVYEKGKRPYVDWKLTDKYLTPILEKIVDRLPQLEESIISKKEEVYSE